MKRMLFAAIAILLAGGALRASSNPVEISHPQTNNLPPRQFKVLPEPIIQALEAKGCLIPQIDGRDQQVNVINGLFRSEGRAAGQKDWAVLCSRNKRSSILVFWNGSPKSVSEIAGLDETGCTRQIRVVGREYILVRYENYKESGAPAPPPIMHQGIEDSYCEKGSVIKYWYRGKWLDLQGAD